MEPEQRKLPRLLCFYTDTTNNSTTKPAPPSTGNQESSSHRQRQHHTTKPSRHPAHQQSVSHHSSHTMKQQTAANHTNHMSRHTKTRELVWQKHDDSGSPSAASAMALYAYLRHALGCGHPEPYDRRCRSSVVGYLETCTSGTLPPCLCVVSPRCRWL